MSNLWTRRGRVSPVLAMTMVVLVLLLAAGCGGAAGGDRNEPGGSRSQADSNAGGSPAGAGAGESSDAGQDAGGSPDTGDPADRPSPGGGAAPGDFPLPVYAGWELMVDTLEGSSRILIFRFEGDRDAVQAQYVQDLTDLGLTVTVDGFIVSAEGEIDGRTIDATMAFRAAGETVHVNVALRGWAD